MKGLSGAPGAGEKYPRTKVEPKFPRERAADRRHVYTPGPCKLDQVADYGVWPTRSDCVSHFPLDFFVFASCGLIDVDELSMLPPAIPEYRPNAGIASTTNKIVSKTSTTMD